MALLEQWQKVAYNEKADRGELQRFWQRYFLLEKGVYEQLLTNPDEKVEGTVKELAEKYNLSVMEMTGFLDGINDSLRLIQSTPWKKIQKLTLFLTKKNYTKTWLTQRQTGYMNYHSGKRFLMMRREELYSQSRRNPALFMQAKKSDVTIHAHAEAVRNTNTAAEDSPPYLNCKKYFTDRRKGYRMTLVKTMKRRVA